MSREGRHSNPLKRASASRREVALPSRKRSRKAPKREKPPKRDISDLHRALEAIPTGQFYTTAAKPIHKSHLEREYEEKLKQLKEPQLSSCTSEPSSFIPVSEPSQDFVSDTESQTQRTYSKQEYKVAALVQLSRKCIETAHSLVLETNKNGGCKTYFKYITGAIRALELLATYRLDPALRVSVLFNLASLYFHETDMPQHAELHLKQAVNLASRHNLISLEVRCHLLNIFIVEKQTPRKAYARILERQRVYEGKKLTQVADLFAYTKAMNLFERDPETAIKFLRKLALSTTHLRLKTLCEFQLVVLDPSSTTVPDLSEVEAMRHLVRVSKCSGDDKLEAITRALHYVESCLGTWFESDRIRLDIDVGGSNVEVYVDWLGSDEFTIMMYVLIGLATTDAPQQQEILSQCLDTIDAYVKDLTTNGRAWSMPVLTMEGKIMDLSANRISVSIYKTLSEFAVGNFEGMKFLQMFLETLKRDTLSKLEQQSLLQLLPKVYYIVGLGLFGQNLLPNAKLFFYLAYKLNAEKTKSVEIAILSLIGLITGLKESLGASSSHEQRSRISRYTSALELYRLLAPQLASLFDCVLPDTKTTMKDDILSSSA